MTKPDIRTALSNSIYATLESYANVHRGSGHASMATTRIFEAARGIVLDYLGLEAGRHQLIFCSPFSASRLEVRLKKGKYRRVASEDIGLKAGVVAIAVPGGQLPRGVPPLSGGGTTKLISFNWVIWASPPAKFEAGTPAVVNIVAFAKALQLLKAGGMERFDAEAVDPGTLLNGGALESLDGEELLNSLNSQRIGRSLLVPTSGGRRRFIDFDHAASTGTFDPVYEVFMKSLFADDRSGSSIVDKVKDTCARFLKAPPDEYELFFTSNTTEAINMVATYFSGPAGNGEQTGEGGSPVEPVVVNTISEHSSNDLPWRTVSGGSPLRVPVSKEGVIDGDALTRLLEEYNREQLHGNRRITVVAVSGASNVLGTCNDLKAIASIVHSFGARLLVDGAQLVAHREVNVAGDDMDFFVCSAHKIYAPFGAGVLVVRKGLAGDYDDKAEWATLGEKNLAGIAALGAMLRLMDNIGMSLVQRKEQQYTRQAIQQMQAIDGMQLMGITGTGEADLDRRVGVVAFNLKGMVSFRIGKELAAHHGIGIRVGCHCAHILVKYILGVGPGLERFQRILQTVIPSMTFPGVARVSFGMGSTEEDLDELVAALKTIAAKKARPSGKEKVKDFSALQLKKVFEI